MAEGTFGNPRIVEEDLDILIIGGGMASCGAAYEMMRWAEAVKAETGTELKIKLVDKAAMDRSGAVAQGLSAINTYLGPELDPADLEDRRRRRAPRRCRIATRGPANAERRRQAGALGQMADHDQRRVLQ